MGLTVITRQYRMTVSAGDEQPFRQALRLLTEALSIVPGFEGAVLLHDMDRPSVYLFSERWSSLEAYRHGASLLPKDLFGQLMRTLGAPPESASFTVVTLDESD